MLGDKFKVQEVVTRAGTIVTRTAYAHLQMYTCNIVRSHPETSDYLTSISNQHAFTTKPSSTRPWLYINAFVTHFVAE